MQDVTYAPGYSASMSGERSESAGRTSCIVRTAIAAAISLALALFWTCGLVRSPSWGWDESMHAELPALRMLLALKSGEVRAAFDALLGCSQYPFVHPAVLATVQSVFGVGEAVCRATGTVVWCAALFGLFLLGRELSREEGERSLTPWIAMGLGALSPMALAFAGTLFLEVPFACAMIFALRAWLRRGEASGSGREIRAGAWIAACLFTKFNYGLLLACGLALDWVCEGIAAAGAGTLGGFARRSAALALVPAAVCSWWFALPLPGGLDLGLEHRRALLAFISGNRDLGTTPYALRLLHASAWLSLTPRLLALIVLAATATLSLARRPAVRAVWLVLLATAGPILAHPFHLDRFLIPIAVPLWALAALGIPRLLPRQPRLRPITLGAFALVTLVFPGRATLAMADRLGWLSADPATRAYQTESVYRPWTDLSASRHLPTAGLERGEADRLLDLAASEAGPTARVGWIGVSSQLSPAAIAIGLLERGGSRERFLRDATKTLDVDYFGADPGWSDEELARFAAGFDVLFATEPPDLKARVDRAWTRRYRTMLAERLGWTVREIGRVAISRPPGPLEVTLLACRPKP